MDDDRQPLLPKQETSFFKEQNGVVKYGTDAHRSKTPVLQQYGSTNAHRETPVLSGATTATAGVETDTVSESVLSEDVPSSLRKPALNVVGLSYEVKERPGQWWNGSCFRTARKKVVLNNLCMSFNAGELTALVGSSGSGKTSLLDIIYGRSQGKVTGVVSYKHETCTRALMKQKSSYVLQADRFLPTLTVRETLTYTAYLKLPGNTSHQDISKKVWSVIEDMGLRHVADSRIGGAVVRGVSGGEKRRISIGAQLLKDPEILLLDEPTSGLDAFTARHLVSSLADLAHKGGKMVILSIHQPRSDIFALLDKMAILTVGQLAYFGRTSDLVPYFTSIGYPCPSDKNPCDVYVDATSVDRRTARREQVSTRTSQAICNAFANSQLQADIVKRITSELNYHYEEDMAVDGYREKEKKPSWPRKLNCLVNRMNVHLWRDRDALVGRFLYLPFFVPFIIMFSGHLSNNQKSVQDRLGIMYQANQVPAYMGLTDAIALFPALQYTFYREAHDGLYSAPTFLLAYYIHILPFNIISSIIFSAFLYWVVGFQSDLVLFGCFILVCVMLIQFGEFMTVCMMGIFRVPQLANNTTSLIFALSGLLASGLLRAVENMPTILQWAGYIAIHKYSTEILVSNEFHGLHLDCDEETQCLKVGDEFIDVYYPNSLANMTRNFALLGGYSVAIYILAAMIFTARGIPTLH